jgi:hypothetical protein
VGRAQPELTSVHAVERQIQLYEPERGGGGFAVFLGRKCQPSLLRYSVLQVLLQPPSDRDGPCSHCPRFHPVHRAAHHDAVGQSAPVL